MNTKINADYSAVHVMNHVPPMLRSGSRVFMRTYLLLLCMLLAAQSAWADDYMQRLPEPTI